MHRSPSGRYDRACRSLPPIGEDIPPLPEAAAAFKQALAAARAAEDRLRRVLEEDGWLE